MLFYKAELAADFVEVDKARFSLDALSMRIVT